MRFRPLAIAGPLFIVFGCMAAVAAAGALHHASFDAGVRAELASDVTGRAGLGG